MGIIFIVFTTVSFLLSLFAVLLFRGESKGCSKLLISLLLVIILFVVSLPGNDVNNFGNGMRQEVFKSIVFGIVVGTFLRILEGLTPEKED